MSKKKTFDTSPEAEKVLHSIMDAELDTQRHIDEMLDGLTTSKKRMKALTRRIYNARAKGEMTAAQAKRAFIDGFRTVVMAHYAENIGKVRKTTDANLEAMYRAVRTHTKAGGKVHQLRPVRNVDLKARASQRAEQKDSAQAGVDVIKKDEKNGEDA